MSRRSWRGRSFRLPLSAGTVEREVDEELRFHLEARSAELMESGHTEAEAREIASREFGDIAAARVELSGIDRRRLSRARWSMARDSVGQDLRHALRGLVREPVFSVAVIVTLGLGVGANAAMFGITDRLLLRPPAHVVAPDGVGRIYLEQTFSWAGRVVQTSAEYPDYLNLREHATAFSSVAAYFPTTTSLGRGAGARNVNEVQATASFFPLLGVRPSLGRFFTEEEDRPPLGEAVAVISDGFWRRHFGGSPDALGAMLHVGERRYRVIGVTPRGFTGVDLSPVDVWVPISAAAPGTIGEQWNTKRGWRWIRMLVRLKPGVTAERASAEATALYRAANEEFTSDSTARAMVGSVIAARGPVSGRSRGFEGRAAATATSARISLWLVGVSFIVLIIACANIANLLLVRTMRRRQEVAVRLALGVGRRRLAAQMLTETLVLTVLGAAAGLAIARWGGALIRTVLLPDIDWSGGVVDGRVLAYALAITLLAGFFIGLAPLGQTLRHDLAGSLRSGARESRYHRSRLRGFLVLLQATLSVVLLVGAGLFVRSLRNIRSLDIGMDPARVLVVTWNEALLSEVNGGDREGFRARALERLQALPIVQTASLSVTSPFYSSMSTDLRIPGRDSVPQLADGGPYVNGVTPDYFATMGTPIVEGRGFTDADREGAPRTVIVGRTMARMLWPGESALGRCMIIGSDDAPCSEVVGVAKDAARQSLTREPVMQYYVPLAQKQVEMDLRVLFARTRGPAVRAIPEVRREIQSLDPAAPYADIRTLESMIDPSVRPWRLGASLFGGFGVLALILATLGLYSVIAYSVAQRTQEMGVRIALGARAADVLRLVLARAMATAGGGVAIGLFVAFLAGPAVQSLLFDVSAHDPAVLLAVAAALLLACLVAGSIPALRAARVDPVTAMRTE